MTAAHRPLAGFGGLPDSSSGDRQQPSIPVDTVPRSPRFSRASTPRRVARVFTWATLTVVAGLASPAPSIAQDQFGAAVTVAGSDVVVIKPGNAVGAPTAVVYRRSPDGTWTEVDRLDKIPGGYPGETLVPTLAAGGDVVLVGSGDPAGLEAGHWHERSGDAWAPRVRVPMDPGASAPSGLPAGGLDMATLGSLMGPPARTVALTPDGRRMAVSGGALPRGQVNILDLSGSSWSLVGSVTIDHPSSTFAPPLAIGAEHLVVGAPQSGPGGTVSVFSASDGWERASVIEADSSDADGMLGAAVALDPSGSALFASAPGAGRVVRYSLGADGSWQTSESLLPPESGPIALGFGSSMAADGDRLLVGSPFAEEGSGRVYVYRRSDAGWMMERTLTPGDIAGSAFGLSVGLSASVAAVGAPAAFGGDGRVAVYDLEAGGAPSWLEPVEELNAVAGTEPVLCADGEAAGFSCEGVDLVSFLPLSALGAEPGEGMTDIWGWTDPETRREYVLAGRTAGLAFIDVTDPGSPRFLGLMPANPSHARDIKVYRDHAFMTGDGAGEHGLLVFDLARLRGLSGGEPATFEPDARYDQVASAHNLVIDTESGFAYTVGTNTGGQSCGGGLHMIDIREPLEPTFAGCFTDTEGLIWSGRTHDAQCTVYRGPDENYRGRQICFASNETAMRIVDVTDKSAPRPISTASHPGTAYIHQGWLTEDHRYLYVNDELDEIVGTTDRTRTLIYDVAELDDPILIGEHLGPDRATDHNLFIAGSRAYLANYQAGFRVLNVSDPESPVEIGWFDTTPYGENPPGFGGGAWTAWPFFESGMVVVSSMNEGLFILRPQRPVT